jgi:hypothetical protein
VGTTPSGPVTPNRSNTDIYPPSRLLPPTQGSAGTQTPAGGSTLNSPGTGAATSTPGNPGAASAADTPGSTTQSGASSSTQDGSTTATTTNGQQGTGGSTNPARPIPPNSQTSSGGGPATRTGKNSSNETVADCMKLWEPTTHMSKADWSRTCRRVQGRLDQVTKQVMTK